MNSRKIVFGFAVGQAKLRFCARQFVCLAVFCLFCLLLALGFWQLARLAWKQEVIAQREARAQLSAIDYDSEQARFDEKDAFTRVRIVGNFDFANEQFLLRRHIDGRPGWHVLTPFILSAGGGVVFVNRGWVDFEHRKRETRSEKNNDGEVTLEGLLYSPRLRGGWLMPDDEPDKRTWYRENLQEMAQAMAQATARNIAKPTERRVVETRWLILADKNPWGEFPQGRQWSNSLRNAHASYAATWFLLSVALLAVFFSANIERQKTESKKLAQKASAKNRQ